MSARDTSSETVLLIAPQPPPYGGVAIQAEKLAQLLRGDGHRVVFIASNLPFPRGLGFVERIRVIRPFIRSVVLTCKLGCEMRRADVAHVFASSWLYFFLIVAPAVIEARLRGTRIVVNYHGGAARDFFRRYGWLAAPIFRLSDEVTAPSRFLAEVIQNRFGIPVRIVPNIVDSKAFRYRQRRQFAPKLLVTRHLEKIYGVDAVLRAFARVQERFPEASLEIAGTGSQEKALRSYVAEAGFRNVRFRGFVNRADLPELYDRSDILLNGSYVDNFPGSLLEASASGLAVISTNAGGIPAIYEHRRSALLVETGDWCGLAAGVQALVEDASLGMRLTTEARKLCERCEWEQVRVLLYGSYGFPGATATGGGNLSSGVA